MRRGAEWEFVPQLRMSRNWAEQKETTQTIESHNLGPLLNAPKPGMLAESRVGGLQSLFVEGDGRSKEQNRNMSAKEFDQHEMLTNHASPAKP